MNGYLSKCIGCVREKVRGIVNRAYGDRIRDRGRLAMWLTIGRFENTVLVK